jgi:hypothetical protein
MNELSEMRRVDETHSSQPATTNCTRQILRDIHFGTMVVCTNEEHTQNMVEFLIRQPPEAMLDFINKYKRLFTPQLLREVVQPRIGEELTSLLIRAAYDNELLTQIQNFGQQEK